MFNIPYSTIPHHSILLQVIVFFSSDISLLQVQIQANAFHQKLRVHLQIIDNQADIQ
jgi:hypothetical protein